MSIKLNVGTSKKIGLPDYGSAGSQCNLEVELDSSALDHPEEFHRRVQEAYTACRCAVEDELGNHRNKANRDNRPTPPPATEYRNSPPPERNDNRFPVSDKAFARKFYAVFTGWMTRLHRSIDGVRSNRFEYGFISRAVNLTPRWYSRSKK